MKAKIIASVIGVILIILAPILYLFTVGHEIIGVFVGGIGALIILFVLISVLANRHRRAAKWIRGIIIVLIVAGAAVFIRLEASVISSAGTAEDASAEYLIVLGAKVNGKKPSMILTERLRAALEYMEENPESIAIVSGGQGDGESISEAEAMQIWLVDKGISEERILMEDKSTTTRENLKNSVEIIKDNDGGDIIKAAIVTSDFHMYRALVMAQDAGIDAVARPAHTRRWDLRLNYYLREPFALIKMYLFE